MLDKLTEKLPNFFILGAPKCGTTSLAQWLGEHPNVYMSPVKEPHFFNTDMKYINTPNQREYLRLFNQANENHKAIGEASALYLYSAAAVQNIENYIDGAKYILLLRNPIEMAYSFHNQLLFSGNEHITNFEEAWHLQEERKNGHLISPLCLDPKLLIYGEICRLGEQVDHLFKTVDKRRVLIILLEDMKKNPREEYLSVLSFLELEDDQRVRFEPENTSKVNRSQAFTKLKKIVNIAMRRMGIPRLGTGISKRLNEINKMERPREPLPELLRQEMINYFRQDIEHLSFLIKRDLHTWLQ